MKKYSILLIIVTVFLLSSCAVIYPSLPDVYIDKVPSNEVEVYCYKENEEWLCAAKVNNEENQNYEEIRYLKFVSLLDMKKILASKGLSEYFSVIIVDFSCDKVQILDREVHKKDYLFLMENLKY